MISDEAIINQIKFTLRETDFKNLGKKYQGKARDIYVSKDKVFLISTDRQSAFDRNLAIIPFKGQVLTQTSAFWFDKTRDIIPNHIIAVPDPNVIVGKNLNVFSVEVIVRGYITGVTGTSAWTAYRKGERNFCGSILPEGLQKNQKFNKPIITPTTKSEEHDEQISPEEIVKRKLMTQEQWNYLAEKALKLFKRGSRLADKNGLILVDTKYEFGYDDKGKIYLIDEINTPDSVRFWLKDTYKERIAKGEEPENIDKEFLRLWFKEHCDPYRDKVLPEAPEGLVLELSNRYIRLYETIMGKQFEVETGEVSKRIEKNLKKAGYLKKYS
jgi:phosphoribosylaminoimidazole-succinocarboxamide synthase